VTAGAVSTPVLEIEPAVVDHVTFILVEPLTVAENCWVAPEATVALVGEIWTLTCDAGAIEIESFLSPTFPALSLTNALK
jgi:hypothetical protein